MIPRISLLIFICICVATNPLSAKSYHKGYLIFKDGEQINGLIKEFESNSTKIHFRASKADKEEKFKSGSLSEIGLFSKEDTIIFHNYQLAKYNGLGKVVKIRGYCWANKNFDTDVIEAFQFWLYTLKGAPLAGVISPVPFVYQKREYTYAMRFPDMDEIILIGSTKDSPKKYKSGKALRRISRYMSKHCENFKNSIEKDKKELKSMYDYFIYYYKTCKE